MSRADLVYQWTEHLYPHARQVRLSLDDTKDVIRWAWSMFRTDDPPKLVQGRYSRTNGVIIELPYQAQTLPIILHEVAHALVLDADDDPHGEQFILMLIKLYESYLPSNRLMESAREYGLVS